MINTKQLTDQMDFHYAGHHVLVFIAQLHGWHWAYQLDERRPSELPKVGATSAAKAVGIAVSRARWEIDRMRRPD